MASKTGRKGTKGAIDAAAYRSSSVGELMTKPGDFYTGWRQKDI